MQMGSRIIGAAALAVSVGFTYGATGWRGDGSGVWQEAQPPLGWSSSSNVLWRTPLPSFSNASPVPEGDRVYVCAEPATLLCVSLQDGRILWQRQQDYADVAQDPGEAAAARDARRRLDVLEAELNAAEQNVRAARNASRKNAVDESLKAAVVAAEQARDAARQATAPYRKYQYPPRHDVTGQSTPTPVAEKDRVYALFALGTLAAYDADGTCLWAREVPRPKEGWGHSASPRLAEGLLLVQIGNRVLAIEAASGVTRWEAESRSGWGTPAVATLGGHASLLTPAGDCFAVADGRKLAGAGPRFPWNGPVVQDGTIYKMDEDGAAAVAFHADGSCSTRWTATVAKERYYATGVVHEGLFYNIHQAGLLTVLDAADGSPVYTQKMDFGRGGRTVYPSPLVAAGRIYLSADNGTTVVIAAGRSYQELGRNTLEPFRSTPSCAGRRLLIRSLSALWCLGE